MHSEVKSVVLLASCVLQCETSNSGRSRATMQGHTELSGQAIIMTMTVRCLLIGYGQCKVHAIHRRFTTLTALSPRIAAPKRIDSLKNVNIMHLPVFCCGGVCVPLNLLLPFLVALCHRAGWLQWFNKDWVTFRWWKSLFVSVPKPESTTRQCGCQLSEPQATGVQEGSKHKQQDAPPAADVPVAVRRSPRQRTPPTAGIAGVCDGSGRGSAQSSAEASTSTVRRRAGQ